MSGCSGERDHREQQAVRGLAAQHHPVRPAVGVEALPLQVLYDGAQRRQPEPVQRLELDGQDLAEPELGVDLAQRRVERRGTWPCARACSGRSGKAGWCTCTSNRPSFMPGRDLHPREVDVLALDPDHDRLRLGCGRPRVDVGPGLVRLRSRRARSGGPGHGAPRCPPCRSRARASETSPAAISQESSPSACTPGRHRRGEGLRVRLAGDGLLGERAALRGPPVPEGRVVGGRAARGATSWEGT